MACKTDSGAPASCGHQPASSRRIVGGLRQDAAICPLEAGAPDAFLHRGLVAQGLHHLANVPHFSALLENLQAALRRAPFEDLDRHMAHAPAIDLGVAEVVSREAGGGGLTKLSGSLAMVHLG